MLSITPTMGRNGNAFVTGKLAYMPGSRNVLVDYIGQSTRLVGTFYRTVDVWTTRGLTASAYIRFERADGKGRATFAYDPAGAIRRAIREENTV